jgi:hypothetical protein
MIRKIEELIYREDSAWSMIQEWLINTKNDVEVLSNLRNLGEETLQKLQVTNKSTMGAIALECGGFLVDKGWLRILGSGSDKISGNLLSGNNLDGAQMKFSVKGALIIAYDIVGGIFAINSGAFGYSIKNIFYLAPDTLEWEDTEKGYTDFIYWALHGDLNLYYKTFRWSGWQNDVKNLLGSQGISIYPYLWTKQGENIEECHREAISMKEIWNIENEFIKQMMR